MTLAVLIAVRGAREAAVAAAIGSDSRLTMARRCADLPEALAAAAAGIGAVVVVSEHPRLDRNTVAALGATGATVVGVALSEDSHDHLGALGIVHLVAADATPAQIADTIVDAHRQSESEPTPLPPPPVMRPRRGTTIAVWGPTGAPGRTTVAVNLAAELAAHGPAFLVDVDTHGGAVAQALGIVDEAPGLAAVARASLHGALDDATVVQHALVPSPNFHVLTGVTRADRWPELPPAALDPLWPVLARHADAVVVDCGFGIESDESLQYDTRAPQRHGATLSALAAADLIVVVGSAEPLSMQRLVNALAALDHVSDRGAVPRMVVVNRVRASVVGPYPRGAVADALSRYAGVERVWTLPYDPRAGDNAALLGQTLAECAPRSALRKAIAGLAAACLVKEHSTLASASHPAQESPGVRLAV